MAKELTTVKLQKELVDKLKARRHPGQSLNGVIQELLNKVGNSNDMETPEPEK